MEIMKVCNYIFIMTIYNNYTIVFISTADDSAGTSHSSDVENSDCEGLKYASSLSPSPSPKPQNYDFQLCVDCKSSTPLTVHLYAPSLQEKTAWVSDISQVSKKTLLIIIPHRYTSIFAYNMILSNVDLFI